MKTFRVKIDQTPIYPNAAKVIVTKYFKASSIEALHEHFKDPFGTGFPPVGGIYSLVSVEEIKEEDAPKIDQVIAGE